MDLASYFSNFQERHNLSNKQSYLIFWPAIVSYFVSKLDPINFGVGAELLVPISIFKLFIIPGALLMVLVVPLFFLHQRFEKYFDLSLVKANAAVITAVIYLNAFDPNIKSFVDSLRLIEGFSSLVYLTLSVSLFFGISFTCLEVLRELTG